MLKVSSLSNQVLIQVESKYQEEFSPLKNQEFIYSYTITIENLNKFPIQLISRKWLITNSDRQIEMVEGKGVVGLQPIINPNQKFSYTSGTQISTEIGKMEGNYWMRNLITQELFIVLIPAFILTPNFKNN